MRQLMGSRNATAGTAIPTFERAGPVRAGSVALDPA